MQSALSWARSAGCSVQDLAALLATTRDHHIVRKVLVVSTLDELETAVEAVAADPPAVPTGRRPRGSAIDAAAVLESGGPDELKEAYESGANVDFGTLYSRYDIPKHLLRELPTYPFQRRWCFPDYGKAISDTVSSSLVSATRAPTGPKPKIETVSSTICSVLNRDSVVLDPSTNIFDFGVDSLTSIEVARALASAFSEDMTSADLYRLLTVQAIYDHLTQNGPTTIDVAAECAKLLEEFSTPLESNPSKKRATSPVVVLTGSTGFLGSRVLVSLLSVPGTQVYALVRGGNPLARLEKIFSGYGMDVELLHRAIANNTLHPVQITDLSHERFGSSEADYEAMLKNINTVVHCAWKVDFNFSVGGFRGDLSATRRLAELCAKAEHEASYFFSSSFATSFGYPGVVPEDLIDLKVEYSLDQVRV
jgi:acyl carrier protein